MKSLKTIKMTGRHAANQNNARQPDVVFLNAIEKTTASKYPKGYPLWNMPESKPRLFGGQSSSAVVAAFPYRPPMAMPKQPLNAKNCSYV
jgi:hypothetical protein